jgi:hypothetical protein
VALNPQDLSDFPQLEHGRAQWAPIYLEALPGSGERLTVAVAAQADDGSFSVALAIPPTVIACMYAERAAQVQSYIDTIRDSLRRHLEAGAILSEWAPPFDGTVFLGPVGPATGVELEAVLRGACQLTSSIAVSRAGGSVEMQLVAEDEAAYGSAPSTDNWEREIRKRVVERIPDYDARFNRSIRGTLTKTRIGYLGTRVAANFAQIAPGRPFARTRTAGKAKLFDLQLLRDLDGLAPRPYYELLVSLPARPSPGVTAHDVARTREAAAELEQVADEHELRVQIMGSPDAAAERILSAEANG